MMNWTPPVKKGKSDVERETCCTNLEAKLCSSVKRKRIGGKRKREVAGKGLGERERERAGEGGREQEEGIEKTQNREPG